MSIGTDSPADSQYLLSSSSSFHPSKKASSEISKVYKHASQLYLTRRLAEAYEALQPIIKPPVVEQQNNDQYDDHAPQAPIATAATSQRIKIWSLYVTLLNSVVEDGPEEGRHGFGSREYSNIVRSVQSGDIWEQVVKNGYQGRESSVDAEVVYNLSNLLLQQAPTQSINQSRLETYLSCTSRIDLDISAHLHNSLTNGRRAHMSGANTPKDLSSRIKILELFTLHVLPQNDEWEYSKSFINNSDILDEERKEAFLQTLIGLEEAKEQEQVTYTDAEEDLNDHKDTPHSLEGTDAATRDLLNHAESRNGVQHKRTSSEVDYGIDQGHPLDRISSLHEVQSTGITSSQVSKTLPIPTATSPKAKNISDPKLPQSGSKSAPPSARRISKQPSKSSSKPVSKDQPSAFIRQAKNILLLLRNLSSTLSSSIANNPTALLRSLMFVVAFLVMLSRPQIRERVKRIVETGWGKLKGTVGMGVKVSYI